ncbi:MAG: hypothetical protein GF411_10220 [Candidatus Lokiarchaeota archaeon]|nr:hypothetical protein [Candidatus Lokiarchaeota archaeon]
MNKLSHMLFAFSLFFAIYSLIYAFSVWQSDLGTLMDMLSYFLVGGIAATFLVPVLYYKAPHKGMRSRTTSNRGAVGAMTFIAFCFGSLGGTIVYQWISGVPIVGNISIFMGALMTVVGALMPDWDIPLMGISRHRNVIFHSFLLPFVVVMGTLFNTAAKIASSATFSVGVHIEYYITALFLIGYASHLYLDIFPSDASPLEIIWRAANPTDQAPTGLKRLGPIYISKKRARGWLVSNATILVIIALALLGLYFYNLPTS